MREFDPEPVARADLGRWLSVLSPTQTEAGRKYLYGSASGVYPVQVYLYVKADRVANLPGGTYYYDAPRHELQGLDPQAVLNANLYRAFVSHPIFESAGFALFMIAKMNALRPLYGPRGDHYATLEAGLMAQLLELAAPSQGLGTCQIGEMRFKIVRSHFLLDEDHVLLHSLLGGRLIADGRPENDDDQRDRIQSLSESELDAMQAELKDDDSQ